MTRGICFAVYCSSVAPQEQRARRVGASVAVELVRRATARSLPIAFNKSRLKHQVYPCFAMMLAAPPVRVRVLVGLAEGASPSRASSSTSRARRATRPTCPTRTQTGYIEEFEGTGPSMCGLLVPEYKSEYCRGPNAATTARARQR